MNLPEASKALREASADLEALREVVRAACGPRDGVAKAPEDQPILDAWTLARARFRAACEAYVSAGAC